MLPTQMVPTQMVQHKDLSLSNNHSGVSFTFVSGTPNFEGLTSSDLFKFAIRTDDYKLFYLASIDPTVVWKEVPIPADLLGLGESSSTAYRGDRGKTAYDFSQNEGATAYNHSQVTHDKNLVGLGNVDNTADSQKPISNATQTELDLKQMKFVGICQKTPLTEANISFNHDTLVLTVTPSVVPGYFDFFTDGQGTVVKHRKSSPVDFPAITNTTGLWYFYFNSAGEPISSQIPWQNFDVISMVWRISWNATLTGVDRIITNFVEYHQNSISSDDHAWKHANGTIWLYGFDSVHTALSSGSPATSGLNTCFSITSGASMDDNLYYSVTNSTNAISWNQDCGNTSAASMTISNSGIFPVRYKGTGGLPVITTSNGRFPFLWNSGSNRPEYVNTSGDRVVVPDDNYFVYFLYSIQDPRTGMSIRLTPSYGTYANLTSAQAITWANVQTQDDGAKDNEIRVLYRLIFQASNSGGNLYPVEVKYTVLREVADLRKVIITQASVTGGSLPASSVTVIPSGTLSSTNVQSSLDELGTEKLGFIGNSLSSLPIYVNNAAAVGGGLVVGSLYRTGGDPDLVCIVH